MADDDYERQQQLISEINALIDENNALRAEINMAIENVQVLTANVDTLGTYVVRDVKTLDSRTDTLGENVDIVFKALSEMTRRYTVYKNLSTASKNLTRLTDRYYTEFRFYNRLRRISLGYVIGLDSNIINSESLRKEVEKNYLKNTGYWLSYAIAAVMLWASDEREAAERAMKLSLNKDACRSALFFLLINLRFGRLAVAKQWYADYLDKADLTNLGTEYQYLMEAYLAGIFGTDPEFSEYVSDNIGKALQRVDALTVGFEEKFSTHAQNYAQTYLHTTEREYPTLHEVCSDYDELKFLMNQAEKNSLIASDYLNLAFVEDTHAEDPDQRVEDVLYSLINDYDEEEWKVIKEQKYNEAIVEANGDLQAAQEKYNLQYANVDKKRSLAEFMVDWAFSEDPTITDLTIKRFAISQMKEAIRRGYVRFTEAYRKREPAQVHITIDDYTIECSENDFELQSDELGKRYTKDRLKNSFKDRYVQLFTLICAASVLLLIFTVIRFNPITLTMGILGAAAGGFVLWRRLKEVGSILEEKKRLGIAKLKKALEELAEWRADFRTADAHADEIGEALDQF